MTEALAGGDALTIVRAVLVLTLMGLGLFFTFVSMTGLLRLPDLYSRAHTASQADTLGAGFGLAAAALTLGLGTSTAKTVILLFFIFITNPTAAHAITRAAYAEEVVPWTEGDERR